MSDDDDDMPDIEEEDIVYFRHDNPDREKPDLEEDSFNEDLPNINENNIKFFGIPNVTFNFPDITHNQVKSKTLALKKEILEEEIKTLSKERDYKGLKYFNHKFNINEVQKVQNLVINKHSKKEQEIYDLPEEKAIIEREELKRVIEEIKTKHFGRNYTIKSLSEYAGTNLSNAYSKGSVVSLNSLEKLEYLANRKIQHTIVLGNKSSKRIILERSTKLAELIGFVIVSGSINIHKSENSKNKGYSLYIHFRKRNRSEILINHIKSLVKKLFNIDESKIEIIKNKTDKVIAFRIYSLPICYELFIHGINPDNNIVPNWIFDKEEFIIHCLKGLFNGYGDFDLTLPEYKDSVYGNFSLLFEKASPFSVEIAKDYKKLCGKLEIETTKIYKRKSSKEDPTIRVIVKINKKDSYVKFLDIIKPLIWDIKKGRIYDFFLKAGINPDTIFHYNEDYLLQQEFNYRKELAEYLLSLFEEYGNYDDVIEAFNESINKCTKKPLGKDRIISYIKTLFEEGDYFKCYGSEGYEQWYNNNSRILIGRDLESTTIPYYLNIQIFREIYQILSNNLFDIDNTVVIKSVSNYFIHKKMVKFARINEPNLLEFGRFSKLLKDIPSKNLLKHFDYIIKFIKEINYHTEKNIRISYVKLANRYKILFYHHQHVKQIIEDLKAEFSKEFKVGFDQEYRWHRLRFKHHPTNLLKINKTTLFKKLIWLFEKISKMDYDVDIFRLENPRCSDFIITGSRSKPIQSEILLPYIKKLYDKEIIKEKGESVLGSRLIKYVNMAERYYKNKFLPKSYNCFLSDEGNIYHNQLQNFIFRKDSDIIATELLVWLEINFPLLNIDYLSGHIDFLFFFNNCLYVCDYKPEHRDRIFLRSIPQISAYGLLLEKMMNLPNLQIKCITFNKTNAWEYEPSILYIYIKDIISELKIDYPIDAKWETYLSKHFDFS